MSFERRDQDKGPRSTASRADQPAILSGMDCTSVGLTARCQARQGSQGAQRGSRMKRLSHRISRRCAVLPEEDRK